MMSAARAVRLGRRARRRRADGSRGFLARRAWQGLVRAGDRGQEAAVEAVWELWLEDPGDESWGC
jgi:hypothetical protein